MTSRYPFQRYLEGVRRDREFLLALQRNAWHLGFALLLIGLYTFVEFVVSVACGPAFRK
jgi:hypothetical protein